VLHLVRTLLVVIITVLVFVYVGYGSYSTNSFGVLSDGLHSLGDIFPFCFQLWGILAKLSLFGLAVVELKIRKFNLYFLSITAFGLYAVGAYRLYQPHEIEPGMLHFALVGLTANAVQYFLGHGFERSQMLHLFVDMCSSAGVVAAALLIQTYGFVRMDSIVTILIAIVTTWAAWQCRLHKGLHVHSHSGHGHKHDGHHHDHAGH
jgi:cobalt-zinc-cadmium efflux system protein